MANHILHDIPGPASKRPNTCGYVQFPVTTLRFPMIARPWTCPKPEETCTSSGSYAGCASPVPTKCFDSSLISSAIASACADDKLCCWRPNTACYTWLAIKAPSTYTLYECRPTKGVGTLLSTSTETTTTTTAAAATIISGWPTETTRTTISLDPAASQASQSLSPPTGPITSLPTDTQGEHAESNSEPPPGTVAASIAGALAFLGLLTGAAVYLWTWNRKKKTRQGMTLRQRGSMAALGPFMVSGAGPEVHPPPRGFEMQGFDARRNNSSVYSSTDGPDRRVSEGVVPVGSEEAPSGSEGPRRLRSGDFGGVAWI